MASYIVIIRCTVPHRRRNAQTAHSALLRSGSRSNSSRQRLRPPRRHAAARARPLPERPRAVQPGGAVLDVAVLRQAGTAR